MLKNIDYMKPLNQQLNELLPQLIEHDNAVEQVLSFYLAAMAKISGKSPENVFGYNMQALEIIFGSNSRDKTPKELAESEYAYRVNAIAREIYDKLPEIK